MSTGEILEKLNFGIKKMVTLHLRSSEQYKEQRNVFHQDR